MSIVSGTQDDGKAMPIEATAERELRTEDTDSMKVLLSIDKRLERITAILELMLNEF